CRIRDTGSKRGAFFGSVPTVLSPRGRRRPIPRGRRPRMLPRALRDLGWFAACVAAGGAMAQPAFAERDSGQGEGGARFPRRNRTRPAEAPPQSKRGVRGHVDPLIRGSATRFGATFDIFGRIYAAGRRGRGTARSADPLRSEGHGL